MIQNKIVVRYQDGRINKGVTNDFSPNKDLFHLFPVDALTETKPSHSVHAGAQSCFLC